MGLPANASTQSRGLRTALTIRAHFRAPHGNNIWIPQEYLSFEYQFACDEVVFVLHTFRRWLKNSFFRETGQYDGVTWLNRHLFAHGINESWQQPANFCRLVVALATIAFVESWHDETHNISPLFPDMSDDSKLLWQQALLQANLQMGVKLHEQEMYQKAGRLVPDMPTDNGVTLRSAILKDDCMRDLVRPLRNAGWSVQIGEPSADAGYICAVASSGNALMRIALLYSCATGNEIYKKLAETNDVILYLGAPYHQEQYAHGIKMHVGPLLGWQPKMAPTFSLRGIIAQRMSILLRDIKSLFRS